MLSHEKNLRLQKETKVLLRGTTLIQDNYPALKIL